MVHFDTTGDILLQEQKDGCLLDIQLVESVES